MFVCDVRTRTERGIKGKFSPSSLKILNLRHSGRFNTRTKVDYFSAFVVIKYSGLCVCVCGGGGGVFFFLLFLRKSLMHKSSSCCS